MSTSAEISPTTISGPARGIEIVAPEEDERAADAVLRDGVVVMAGVLSAEQVARIRVGVDRVSARQIANMPFDKANRGPGHYSIPDSSDDTEWAELIDQPAILPVLDRVFGSDRYTACLGGGDYAMPGAGAQELHSDLWEFLHDPHGQVNVRDLPPPWITVNYMIDDFRPDNGPTKFVPGTQRTRHPAPLPENEPSYMKEAQVIAPAGTAVIRDARTWHGATANSSQERRVMVGWAYFAPWYRGAIQGGGKISRNSVSVERFRTLRPRAQQLVEHLVDWQGAFLKLEAANGGR